MECWSGMWRRNDCFYRKDKLMKIETLKEIIERKLSNEQFTVLTNLSNGSSEIFKIGAPLSKNFISYKNEIYKLTRQLKYKI